MMELRGFCAKVICMRCFSDEMVQKEKFVETKLRRRRRRRYVILLFFARYKIEGSNNKIVIASGRSVWNGDA